VALWVQWGHMTQPPETPPRRQRHVASAPSRPPETESASAWSWLLLVGIVVALLLAKWTLLVAVLGLAFLITIHEFGHFVFAKLFGMRVEKFYVGFPPAAWKRTWGETEYGIGLIPLGGFCKISGMSQEEKLPVDVLPRAYFNQPVWKRNVTIFAGPLFNLLAAVVILFVFLMAQGVVKPTLKIDAVAATVQVSGSKVQTPAAEAGLKAGDTLIGGAVLSKSGVRDKTITRSDAQTWKTWSEAQKFLQHNPGRRIELVFRTPDGTLHTKDLTLTTNPNAPTQGFLGVTAGHAYDHQPPWTAGWLAVKDTGGVVKSTFQGFYWLATGKASLTGSSSSTSGGGEGGGGGASGPVGHHQHL